ncbi:MAG: hypothetical protein SO098_01695, partial [Prevotella sp.]|nr:hypothetical protein [Prevotella sp.]
VFWLFPQRFAVFFTRKDVAMDFGPRQETGRGRQTVVWRTERTGRPARRRMERPMGEREVQDWRPRGSRRAGARHGFRIRMAAFADIHLKLTQISIKSLAMNI